MAHKFEIYQDKAGEYRVRFKYNNEIMFFTEGYTNKAGAQIAIDSIKKNGPAAPVEDNSWQYRARLMQAGISLYVAFG